MSLSDQLLPIQRQLTRYCYSTFLVFGVIGGCLNILLLSRTQFRTTSCCIYLLGMSIAALLLVIWVNGLYLYALDHVDPVTSIPVFCKLRIYILQIFGFTYRWCLTIACFDRYALTSTGVRLRNLARVIIARRAVILLMIIWIILPMHSLIFYNLRGNTCGILYSTAGALYHSIFTTIFAAVLPISIMITCAFLIYRNLVRKRQRRQDTTGQQRTIQNETRRLQSKRDQQVLLMLLVQAVCYIVTTIPLMGMYFYNALTIYVTNKSVDRLAIERFSFYLSELINFLLPAASFYLYIMTSQLFRRELINILCSICHCSVVRNTARILPAPHTIPNGSLN